MCDAALQGRRQRSLGVRLGGGWRHWSLASASGLRVQLHLAPSSHATVACGQRAARHERARGAAARQDSRDTHPHARRQPLDPSLRWLVLDFAV